MPITEPAEAPVLRSAVSFPLDEIEWRDSGDPEKKNETTLRGHAAVFNKLSDDLGGFREIIEPGAFRAVLRKQPDVRLLFNHDPNYVLGRTASGTLDLREDPTGLHVFARVDRDIGWVEDLRRSMQRGDVDQMSFAFTDIEDADTWSYSEADGVIRTVRQDRITGLYDASVVTFPGYTQTDVNMRSLLEQAREQGRIPGIAPQVAVGGGSDSHTGSDMRRKRLAALKAASSVMAEQCRTKD